MGRDVAVKNRDRREQDAGVTISRSTQRLLGFCAAAIGACMLAAGGWSATSASRRASAWTPRASFPAGECVIESADVVVAPVRSESTEHTVAARFTLRAGGRTFAGVAYTYPVYFINSEAAARALIERELRPGASHPCWYNPNDPADAALVRAAEGADSPPSAAVGGVVALIGAMLVAAGVAFARSKRRWRAGVSND